MPPVKAVMAVAVDIGKSAFHVVGRDFSGKLAFRSRFRR
jgi:hypothetical protein